MILRNGGEGGNVRQQPFAGSTSAAHITTRDRIDTPATAGAHLRDTIQRGKHETSYLRIKTGNETGGSWRNHVERRGVCSKRAAAIRRQRQSRRKDSGFHHHQSGYCRAHRRSM